MKRYTPSATTHRRSGFSLIELLMVVVIIGILMALILPAIGGARKRAQIAAVATEITKLDQAIVAFKNKYGVEPPSSLNIPTSATGWAPEDRQKISRVWDQFDFTTLGGLGGGYPSQPRSLNGAECLVFFLGGINKGTPTAPVIIGFSNNPRTPWDPAASNRVGPFFDGFDPARISDIDKDGIGEFLDSLPGQTAPYAYFCSQGKSYKKSNRALADDFDIYPDPPMAINNSTSAPPRNLQFLYMQGDGKTPQRATSYQIISPGFDGLYGVGGVFNDQVRFVYADLNGDGDTLDFTDLPTAGVVETSDTPEGRGAEADNIANFSNGVFRP